MGQLQLFTHTDPKPILRKTKKRILLWRFEGQVSYEFIAGLCGPSYAASMLLEGETNDNDISLTVKEDEAAAGVFVGAKVVFPIVFAVESGSPRFSWKHGWSVKWKKSFSISPKPEIDLLKMLIDLIKKLMQEAKKSSDIKEGEDLEGEPKENKEKKPEDRKPKVSVKSWAMFDQVENQFGQNKPGEIAPEPKLKISVNLVPLFPELVAIDKGLKTLWGGLSLGPNFYFIVPVHIRLKELAFDGTAVENLTTQGKQISGSLSGSGQALEQVHAKVDHTVGLTFGTSFFLSISVCKCFSFDPESPMLRLDEIFGWELTTNPHCTGFRNAIGSETSPENPIDSCDTGSVTVVLDP